MLSTSQRIKLNTRREIERKLITLGLTHQDIATALGIDTGSISNDLDKIGKVEVVFGMTSLTNTQRRDKAFNACLREWFLIHDSISDYSKKFGLDQEMVNGIETALSTYLDIKRLNGIAEGVATFLDAMMYPADPTEYTPYRRLLCAIFGERFKGKEKKYSSALRYHFWYIIDKDIELTRDSLPAQLTAWALEEFRQNFGMPFDQTVKTVVDEALGTLPTDYGRKVISLRFGLSDGKELTCEEIGVQFDVTRERIRQIEAKAIRKLKHPTRAKKLKGYLE